MPTVLAYSLSSALRTERRSLRLRRAVAAYFGFALLSLFTSAFAAGLVGYFCVFGDAIDFAELGCLLPSPVAMHAFLAVFGLFSVFQGS